MKALLTNLDYQHKYWSKILDWWEKYGIQFLVFLFFSKYASFLESCLLSSHKLAVSDCCQVINGNRKYSNQFFCLCSTSDAGRIPIVSVFKKQTLCHFCLEKLWHCCNNWNKCNWAILVLLWKLISGNGNYFFGIQLVLKFTLLKLSCQEKKSLFTPSIFHCVDCTN